MDSLLEESNPVQGPRALNLPDCSRNREEASGVRREMGGAEWREVMVEGCAGELQRGLGFASRRVVLEGSVLL